MTGVQTLLDTLGDLHTVLAKVLERVRQNKDEFAMKANPEQLAQFERIVTLVRISSEQLERQLNYVEYSVAKRVVVTSPPLQIRSR